MNSHNGNYKSRRGMVIMSLFLALGLFFLTDIQPSFGLTGVHISAVSSNVTAGTVTGEGDYAPGDTVNLTAIPAPGYRFMNWTEDTTPVSTASNYSFIAEADRSLVANFEKIAAPVISTIVSQGYSSIKLTWTAVPGASSYDVYYAGSASGNYVEAGTVTETSYTRTGLTAGNIYYFKVKANCTAGTTITSGAFSAYKSVTPIPATPVAKAVSTSYTSIKVSWAAVPGATAYKVYRATSPGGNYEYRVTTAKLFYNNTHNNTTGKTNYYKVIAYCTVNSVNVRSKTSAATFAKPIPSAPACAVTTMNATSAKISWSGVAGATKYQIFKLNSSTGQYSLIHTSESTTRSYVNPGLTYGKTYSYKVRACHLEGSSNVYGTCSTVQSHKLGSVYGSGVYKIGTDIPAGEYLFIATNTSNAEFYTFADASATKLLNYGFPNPTIYETLTVGQYVKIVASKAYPIASAPLQKIKADGSFLPGQYKVGRDIPAGTYIITLKGTTDYGDIYIESNSLNNGSGIVGYDSYRGRIYVTLTTGQYFTFDLGVGYTLEKAPALDKSPTYLSDGMYLVGTDIKAGTYTIVPTDTLLGYYEIYSDSTHANTRILKYDNLKSNKVVTVTDGQYLYVFGGKFLQTL